MLLQVGYRLREIRYAFTNVEDVPVCPNLLSLAPCMDRLRPCTNRCHILAKVESGDTTIDGMLFPSGTIVGVSTYALHNEQYYSDPFTFSPECWIIDQRPSLG
jgi:Cytochrome P450